MLNRLAGGMWRRRRASGGGHQLIWLARPHARPLGGLGWQLASYGSARGICAAALCWRRPGLAGQLLAAAKEV